MGAIGDEKRGHPIVHCSRCSALTTLTDEKATTKTWLCLSCFTDDIVAFNKMMDEEEAGCQ